jgi:predicted Rossmann-fold nucleotide-binding protein
MNDKTIYLCGPIMGCTDSEANDWRALVKGLWDGPVLDPMRRDYRGSELESFEEVVKLDKVDVHQSDALIVNFPGPSVGTAMEVYMAFEMGKLVVVVVAPDVRISPWLRYHSHAIVYSFGDAVNVVRNALC